LEEVESEQAVRRRTGGNRELGEGRRRTEDRRGKGGNIELGGGKK
jgi:hypothetical protein